VKENDRLHVLVGKPEGWSRLGSLLIDRRIILKTDPQERG